MSQGNHIKQDNDIELLSYEQKPSPLTIERPINGEYFSHRIYHVSSPSKEIKLKKKYRNIQRLVYMFLEKPSSWTSIVYHTLV